ncbi:LRAT-like domain-containing protein (chloroplast) [Artemisia annua]|uniref:LRAT-like domain-containing protein n=1 Tax=Artemisia annua TaxID=35608 RepID=A0A2U1N5K9_ARTAN|nr:LRAT-like domain-containing protein [Artemisia annua]
MGYLWHRVDPSEIKAGDHIYTWRTAYAYSHHGIYVGEKMVIHYNNLEKTESGPVWNISSDLPSSFTSHYASCLNSHDCEFLQPNTGGNSGSSLSTCSHCTSWNPSIPALCLRLPHCGYRQPDSGVIVSCLNCFIGTGSLYRFQYGVGKLSYVSKIRGGTCTIAKSDPPNEVIDRALYLLRHGFGSYDVVKNNCEDFALYCRTCLAIRGKVTTGSSGQVNFVSNLPWKATLTFAAGKIVSNSFGIVSMAATTLGTYSWNRYKTDIGVRDDVEKVPVEEVVEFRRRNM